MQILKSRLSDIAGTVSLYNFLVAQIGPADFPTQDRLFSSQQLRRRQRHLLRSA